MRRTCLLLAALVVPGLAGCVKRAKKADCERLAVHMQQLSVKNAVKKGRKADEPGVVTTAKVIHDSYLRRCCGNDACSDSWTMKRVTCFLKKDSTVRQADRKCCSRRSARRSGRSARRRRSSSTSRQSTVECSQGVRQCAR